MADSSLMRFAPPDTPGLAKYAQFRDLIVRAIRGGQWRPGARIPTEQELTATLPYSLGTIQRGLRMLVEEGVLTRRAGLGSFVADSFRPMSEPWHLRFEDGAGGVLPLFPKVLAVENPARRGYPAHADLVARLKPRGPVFAIKRLIDVGSLFKVYAYFIAEIGHFPRLATRKPSDLHGQNLRLLLSQELGLPILQGRDTFRVRRAEPSVSARLKLPAGSAVLELCSIASAAGMSVYAQHFLIPPNAPPLMARKDGAQ
jgi:GntR family transcriptional regulator